MSTKHIARQAEEPRRFAVGLVHHCGHTARSDDAHPVRVIHVAAGWGDWTAVLGRSYLVMESGLVIPSAAGR